MKLSARSIALCLLIAIFSLASYSSYGADDKPLPFKVSGFNEAVLIVADIDTATQQYVSLFGWQVIDQSPVDDNLKHLWGLPDNANVTQRLLANIGEDKGYMRLLQISGVKQDVIRANTQSWDTGGIFDLNARVADMQGKHQQLMQAGWHADTAPIQFSFGPFVVKEWIAKGHDAVAFAFIERIKPQLEGWPNLKQVSRVFNSTQVVKDIAKSLAFYQDILGFKMYLEHRGASKSEGANVLGLPHNLTTQIERSVYILHPDGINEGSVELLQFHGAQGKDVSHLAKPPNLGVVTLRFPVDNIGALKKHLQKSAVEVIAETQLQLPPYGLVDILAVQTPDNNWLEFYSPR